MTPQTTEPDYGISGSVALCGPRSGGEGENREKRIRGEIIWDSVFLAIVSSFLFATAGWFGDFDHEGFESWDSMGEGADLGVGFPDFDRTK